MRLRPLYRTTMRYAAACVTALVSLIGLGVDFPVAPVDAIASEPPASVNVGPQSSWISDEVVYCNESNTGCSEVLTGRSVAPVPAGYNRHFDCEWVDAGFSSSLGVDKHFCVALHGALLGSANFAPNGEGWGTPHPSTIFNGGDPSGLVSHIHWRHWGTQIAIGWGRNAIFKPMGGYYSRLATIELRASRPSTCVHAGPRTYTHLEARIPARPGGRLGNWFTWSGFQSLCHGFVG